MIDRLLVNGNVRTLNTHTSRASTLAIYQGKIIAVGDDSLRALADKHTVIDDLRGALVLPGFVDAHIHWQWTALGLLQIDLFDVPSKELSLQRIKEAVVGKQAQQGDWLLGRGWSQSMWPGGAFPTAADLDAVVDDRPALMNARSGHAVWVNSTALRLAGITDSTVNPKGGEIQRDADGHATGILFEDAIDLVADLIPEAQLYDIAAAMEHAQQLAWQVGLTGLHDYDPPSAFEAFQYLHEHGRLGLRVVKNINDPYIQHAYGLKLRWGFGNDWLRLGGQKIFADGALGTRTALMLEPYEGEPSNYGIVVKDKEEMIELVTEASRQGFPSTIHAIGDKAVHDVLDVYQIAREQEAKKGIHPSERRHRIEHVQLIHPDDVARLAALDVIASIQPIHATSDYEMADRYWGKRAAYSYNARLQLDHGARVAFGSDSPVERFEPLLGLYAAVTRRRPDGTPNAEGWYPEARLTVDEAVRGFTQGPAYAAGMEDRLGELAPGYLADLIVLDHDIYQETPEVILKTQVLGTMVGGIWRHRQLR